MPTLALTPDALLTTTRSVRKRLDLTRPVPAALLRECLQIALQAPTGSNVQGWQFVLVLDAAKRRALGELYRRGFEQYRGMPTAMDKLFQDDRVRAAQQQRAMDSASYLAGHMGEVPALLVPCLQGRPTGGPFPPWTRGSSIYPAVWSFMLAARARGLGSCLTSLHLFHEREAAALLGIPYDDVAQYGLVAVGYYTGADFKPAARQPLESVLHVDGWQAAAPQT
jgi:nitroreductase